VTCVIKEPVSCTIIVEYVDIHMCNITVGYCVFLLCVHTNVL